MCVRMCMRVRVCVSMCVRVSVCVYIYICLVCLYVYSAICKHNVIFVQETAPALIVDNQQGGRVLRLHPCPACVCVGVRVRVRQKERGKQCVYERESVFDLRMQRV